MCGFIAMSGCPEPLAQQGVAGMAKLLRHRGPDGEGSFVDRDRLLHHRRLAIIDVKGGAQPLFSEDRSVAAVVNGEIYNHATLRSHLEPHHRFTTRSDSEVVVH